MHDLGREDVAGCRIHHPPAAVAVDAEGNHVDRSELLAPDRLDRIPSDLEHIVGATTGMTQTRLLLPAPSLEWPTGLSSGPAHHNLVGRLVESQDRCGGGSTLYYVHTHGSLAVQIGTRHVWV